MGQVKTRRLFKVDGKDRSRIFLGDLIGEGGEAKVYNIRPATSKKTPMNDMYVAKIYEPLPEGTVILGQEHSKYVNESFFITDPNCEEKLRVFIGSYDPDSTYFLLTDGSCECLLNDRDGTYAPALHTFTKWMWKYPHHAVSKAIGQKMYSLFPKRTDDDCAIALINLPNPSSNDEPDV